MLRGDRRGRGVDDVGKVVSGEEEGEKKSREGGGGV
jgi:hypothetical protein